LCDVEANDKELFSLNHIERSVFSLAHVQISYRPPPSDSVTVLFTDAFRT